MGGGRDRKGGGKAEGGEMVGVGKQHHFLST